MAHLFLIGVLICAQADQLAAYPTQRPGRLESKAVTCIETDSEDHNFSTQLLQSRASIGLGRRANNERAGLPSMVLFTWVYGDQLFQRPLFKLFLASAAGCGADVVVLGDAWPSDLRKPANVRNVTIGWDSLVSLLEEKVMGGESLDAMRSQREYKKINDVKPLTAYLFPDFVSAYDWWGWTDNDLLLGDLATYLLPKLKKSSTDVWSDQVQAPEISSWTQTFGVDYSHGPFTVVRTSSAVSTLFNQEPYRSIIHQAFRFGFNVNFGENGFLVNNYTQSFSWCLLSASTASAIAMTKLSGEVKDVNDVRCNPRHADAPIAVDCGFCAFRPEPVAGQKLGSVVEYSIIGRSVLQDKSGSNVIFCHTQIGKTLPNFNDSILTHLGESRLTYTLLGGFSAGG